MTLDTRLKVLDPRFARFRISHPDMGAIEIFLASDDLRHYNACETYEERRKFLVHETWRKLWESPAQRMLKSLCDNLGVDAVKTRFGAAVDIEEIPL